MIWDSYDRLSDHLAFLGPRLLQDRVDIFFAKVRQAGDRMTGLEKWQTPTFEQARDPSSAMVGVERGHLVGDREKLVAELSDLELEAKKLWLDIYYLGQPMDQREADMESDAVEALEGALRAREPDSRVEPDPM
jgi:hypothetical protein